MTTRYLAFGLELRASFPLPGMTSDEMDGRGALPSLELSLARPAELESAWSGSDGPPMWRGRLGDGRDLVLEQGAAGDLLFTYGDRARFRLDARGQTLVCAPNEDGLDWQRALLSKVLSTISVMRGYEALHAAALDSPAGVVAIMAPSGSGKSTLALELLRKGRPLFSDDVLILEATAAGVRAHPGTPHMNLAMSPCDSEETDVLGSTLAILADERWLAASVVADGPRPVRMLCLLERHADLALEIQPLRSNSLPLTPYMLGLSGDPERDRSRFCLYADLAQTASLVRLTASLEHSPRQLAELLEEAFAGSERACEGPA